MQENERQKSHCLANLCSPKMDLIKMVVEVSGAILLWNHTCYFKSNSHCMLFRFCNHAYDFRPTVIIYMKKLLDSDWLRIVQFFLNTVQKRGNWMHKKGNKASILIGQWTKKFTESQSNLLFSNQARALDGAIMAQFFPDCVITKITWG